MGGKNRIVVDYGDRRDLVLLTAIETKTGIELFYDDLRSKYSKYFTVVDKINVNSLKYLLKLKETGEDNREGFVVRFENGFRLKIKYPEYIRLHGILTNVSNLKVWEYMKNGYDFDDLMDRVPDEFYNWLIKTKDQLQKQYNTIENEAIKEFIKIYCFNSYTTRKEFAMEAKKYKYPSILFRIYDMKSYDQIIWKNIRPKFSKPFQDGY
jgi:RNA ligase